MENFDLKGLLMGLAIPVISIRRLRRVIDEDLSQEDTRQASDIPNVENFVHILSKDLSGLPHNLKIELIIELLSNTTLLSTTSYCVIPTGLNGLKFN